ncbi:MAG TPA: hypothetical protein VD814_11100 [Nocardioides sp.]|nr:hypothetical protein [Nocardioides sp.]
MTGAAIAFWVITMGGGAWMWGRLERFGSAPREVRHTRLPPSVMAAHPLLAGLGFVLLLAYAYSGSEPLAWGAFGSLLLVSALGGILFLRWHQNRKAVATAPAEAGEPAEQMPLAEQEVPSLVVHAHGALAAVTLGLVLGVALQAG